MPSPYNELIDLMTRNGLSQFDAEQAAKNCGKAMARNGYATGAAVGLVGGYFMAMNPLAALGIATTGFAAGSLFTLSESPSCLEVRQAASFWLSSSSAR